MPRFAFGLDISDRSAELVSLLSLKGSVIVDRYGRTEIPPGVINRGTIVDKPRLTYILSAFLDDFFGPKRAKIAAGISLPETLVYSGAFSYPAALDEGMVAKAVRRSAAERFPISLSNVVTDTCVLSQDETSRQLLHFVAQRDEVEAYREVLEAVGVKPQFFDSEAMALGRALVEPRDPDPLILADIGARTTGIDVYDRGGLWMTSSVAVAGDQLTAAIEMHLDVTLAKAEELKQREGFDPAASDGRAFLILQRPLTEIIEEIRKTMNYYNKKTGRPIRGVVLAGGTSLTPYIVDYVASNLTGLTVTLGDPLRGIKIERLVDAEKFKKASILYATAIGLALRAIGVRTSPGIDLTPGRGERHGGAAMFSWLRHAGAAIVSMTTHKKKPSKKPEEEGAEEESLRQEAPAASEAPSDKPAEEAPTKPAVVASQPSAGPVIDEHPVEVPSYVGAESDKGAPAEENESPADYGRNIGDILGGTYGIEAESEGEDEAADADVKITPTKPESERLAIESILDRAKNRGGGGGRKKERVNKSKIILVALMVLVILFLIAAIGGVIMFVKKNGLSALSVFRGEGKQKPTAGISLPGTQPGAPKELSSVSVTVLAGLESKVVGDKPFVLARAIETDVSASDTFQTTGETATAQGKAKGFITIVNTTPRSYTFVATTRFLTEDNVLFRMDKTTAIPSSGTVKVAVTADKSGPGGDIGPSKFTIPGLSKDQQKVIYGQSDSPMTGGGGKAQSVSAADLTAAKAKLTEKLQQDGRNNFQAMLQSGEQLLPELVTSSEISFTAPAAGTVGTTFTAKLTLRFRAMIVPEKDFTTLLNDKFKSQVPAGVSVADYELAAPQYTVEAFPEPYNQAEIRAEAAINKTR